jgi:hypothetical protein
VPEEQNKENDSMSSKSMLAEALNEVSLFHFLSLIGFILGCDFVQMHSHGFVRSCHSAPSHLWICLHKVDTLLDVLGQIRDTLYSRRISGGSKDSKWPTHRLQQFLFVQ